jgi:putative mRNA 3-end processing factor
MSKLLFKRITLREVNIEMKDNFQSNPLKEFRTFINNSMSRIKESKHKKENIDINYNNNFGLNIYIDGINIAIDHWNPNADIIFVSHAHMDHIPFIPEKNLKDLENNQSHIKFICSKITKEIAEVRSRGNFNFPENSWLLGKDKNYPQSIDYNGVSLSLLENGHTYGSLSLLIEGSERILYTSDFITKDRLLFNGQHVIKGLIPINCERLIMECTFGAPNYIFPSFQEIRNDLNKFIEKEISEGHPIIILGYAFGKSQITLNILDTSHRIILDKNIAKLTKILENEGIKTNKWEPYGNFNKNQLIRLNDYILLIPPYYIFREPYKSLINAGAKVVYLSGKVLNESSRREFPADKYIPFSDHCDFNDLIEFINKCNPTKIYLGHGKIEEFSYYLSKINRNQQIFCIRERI